MDVVEDKGGIFPTHITGIMLETTVGLKELSELQFSASLGFSSVFKQKILEPFDLLNPESGHQSAIDLRLAYLPDQFKDNQFGMTISYADLSVLEDLVILPNLESVQQYSASLYVDWRFSGWRLISSVVHTINELKRETESERDRIVLAYGQAEYMPDKRWTVFSRLENIRGKNSRYLSIFPDAIVSRQMIGARLDLNKSQALSFEVSRVKTLQQRLPQYLLQWSTVFP
jgi:hypothetical protein